MKRVPGTSSTDKMMADELGKATVDSFGLLHQRRASQGRSIFTPYLVNATRREKKGRFFTSFLTTKLFTGRFQNAK